MKLIDALLSRLTGKRAAPDLDDDAEPRVCELCDGEGWVRCRCGGDLCVCENYGEAICPKCGGA